MIEILCDRCGKDTGKTCSRKDTENQLTPHPVRLSVGSKILFEGDLCDDCLSEITQFIKTKKVVVSGSTDEEIIKRIIMYGR